MAVGMTKATEHLSESATENIQKWLNEPKYAQYKAELEAMIADERWQELEDAFFKVIEFGTGGRRGTTGIGSNRINRVTMGESAQALCEYAREADPAAAEKGVVIACDTRLSSPELSRYVASVCAANGFRTYMFDGFRATPELSFAVRHLGAAIGIVVSASHNPPADNGFKGYWSDGGQLVAPHDKGVLEKAAALSAINDTDFDEAVADGRITIIGSEVDEAYVAAVVDQAEGSERDVSIVYSPLHGAGQTNVLPVLRAAGFTDITTVDEQMVPDGNFPTVPGGKANPEERAANDMAVAKMMEIGADIAITNDPDADRIGAVARDGDAAVYLTGNQSAALATDYALKQLQAKGQLTNKHYIAKTIVTTDLLDAIATKYGATTYGNFLVGFKYIGALLLAKELTDEIFVIGGEESYGLLKGDYARDKDGAVGALPLAEYAAELKAQGSNLVERLYELFAEHGVFVEQLANVVCPGADGFEKMQTIMRTLREQPPVRVGDHEVTAVLDYASLLRRDLQSGEETSIDCDAGNVVVLEFGDQRRRITVRPSGTEPKIKLYVQWHEATISTDPADVRSQKMQLDETVRELIAATESSLVS